EGTPPQILGNTPGSRGAPGSAGASVSLAANPGNDGSCPGRTGPCTARSNAARASLAGNPNKAGAKIGPRISGTDTSSMRTGTNRVGYCFASTRAAVHSCVVHLTGSKYASDNNATMDLHERSASLMRATKLSPAFQSQ